jgi:hypothetical protein
MVEILLPLMVALNEARYGISALQNATLTGYSIAKKYSAERGEGINTEKIMNRG